jgi:hypothetical protein
MSHNVSFSKIAAQSNPDQFKMRVVIEEDSFHEDKEKLRYSAEELDEILRAVIEDIAKRPEEHFSLGPNFGMERIGSGEPALYIWFTFDADSVHLILIKEG